MKNVARAILLVGFITSMTWATNVVIGNGNSGIAKATVRAIRVFNGNTAVFWIAQTSSTVPYTRYWNINLNDAWGKSALATLFAAQAAGASIEFYESTGTGDSYGCSFITINY